MSRRMIARSATAVGVSTLVLGALAVSGGPALAHGRADDGSAHRSEHGGAGTGLPSHLRANPGVVSCVPIRPSRVLV